MENIGHFNSFSEHNLTKTCQNLKICYAYFRSRHLITIEEELTMLNTFSLFDFLRDIQVIKH